MKKIAVFNQKGGSGKSVTTTQLGFHVALMMERRTMIVDLDQQANTTTTMRDYEAGNKASTLFDSTPLQMATNGEIGLFSSDGAALRSLEKIPAEVSLDANRNVILPEVALNLKARLDEQAANYDVCFIDTPGSNSVLPNTTLLIADYVLIPCVMDSYHLQVLKTEVLPKIFNVQRLVNPNLKIIGILPSKFKSTDRDQVQYLTQLLQTQKDLVLRAKLSDRSAFPHACDIGVPLWKVDRSAARAGVKEVRDVAEAIAEKIGGF